MKGPKELTYPHTQTTVKEGPQCPGAEGQEKDLKLNSTLFRRPLTNQFQVPPPLSTVCPN